MAPHRWDALIEGTSLVLDVKPAGFGKTTAVGDWVAARPRDEGDVGVAWLSLDEGDNDVARFLTDLVLAVSTTSSRPPSSRAT